VNDEAFDSSSGRESAPPTFIFAPEIEQALVALCFQAPSRVATVYRQLDPAVHITRPELRFILEAIDLAYRELGLSDFASVVQVLRELGHFEACGGLHGVNAVFEEYRYGFSSPEAEEEIFTHYIGMLKIYAHNRALDPPQPVIRVMGGHAHLLPNKNKRKPSDPDFIGEAKIAGRHYWISAWKSEEILDVIEVKIVRK